MKKSMLAAIAGIIAGTALLASPAMAHDRVGLSIGIGVPLYAPAPTVVYAAPPQVVYAPPPPVYVAPRRVVYAAPVVEYRESYYGYPDSWHHRHHHHHHHRWHD